VYTDWLVVRRLAIELERAVRGARIRDVGITADGRFALRVRARGAGGDAVVIDAFGDTPIVTLENGVELTPQPGWPRTIRDSIADMRVERIRSRRGDRLVAIDVATLSRFGVLNSYRIVAELVPRFGNLLLLRSDAIVAAAREFTSQQNPRRPIVVGGPYTPPPLPEPAMRSGSSLADALARFVLEPSPSAQQATVRELRARVPLLPELVASSLLAQVPAGEASDPVAAAEHLVQRAGDVLAAVEAEPDASGPIFAYSEGGRIVQAHVVPLAQFAAFDLERRESLLDTLADAVRSDRAARTARDGEARRHSLLARIERRRAKLRNDRASLEAALTEEQPERLREAGTLLYAHHEEVPQRASSFVVQGDPPVTIALDPELDAKSNAAAIFKRYRKALGRHAHAEQRLNDIAAQIAAAEQLAWELERSDPSELDELGDDAERLDRSTPSGHERTQQPRSALEVTLADDARILVGRSPKNNAELTFRIARPDDFWFHARGVPGAHVVLRIDSSRAPTTSELQSAAELAAYHSKARTAGIVPVDYTRRKYVRKQQNALPGLVWYTNAKTIDVTPRTVDSR